MATLPERRPAPSRHPVVDLILARAAEGSVPGRRSDEHRLGLVIASGAMRGVISGGMVTALHDLGLLDVFDVVYGASAGAFAGAYFLAGEPALGTSIYYEDLVSGEFVSYRRARGGGTLMSLDYVIDEVMVRRKPIDWLRVVESPAPLRVVATSASSFEPVGLGDFADGSELRTALHATARIPLVAGPPVAFRGELLVDGGIVEPIPTRTALADGCTHVLVLLNHRRGQIRDQRAAREDGLMCRYLNKRIPGLGTAYTRRAAAQETELRALERQSRPGQSSVPALYAVDLLPDGPDVMMLELDADALFAGAAAGAEAIHRTFTASKPRFYRRLATY